MYEETDFAGGSTLHSSDGTSITIERDEDGPYITKRYYET